MRYTIVDENGEVQAEFDTSEKWLPRLLERLTEITTLEEIARYTPTETTLMKQLCLLAEQSKDNPLLAAANTEAMCGIAQTLAKRQG